jgi:hypothetical protein
MMCGGCHNAVAKSKGVESLDYLVAHTNIGAHVPAGMDLQLPAPTYFRAAATAMAEGHTVPVLAALGAPTAP